MNQSVLGDLHPRSGDLFARLKRVATVGVKRHLRCLHQAQSSATGEAAKILDVREVGDQERISLQAGKTKPEPICSAPA
jgi:hypothetical protein